MNYCELMYLIQSMTPQQLDGDVVITDIEGGVYPVYGVNQFTDCSETFDALVAAVSTGDNNVHPVYMKGRIYNSMSDAEVMEMDKKIIAYSDEHTCSVDKAIEELA